MSDKTNIALIKKHGFRSYCQCMFGSSEAPESRIKPDRDVEGKVVKDLIRGDKIVELGCGSSKTVEGSVGVDLIQKGDIIHTLERALSVADVVADITKPLPFADESIDTIVARHIFEHCVDSIGCLRNWTAKIKKDGRLIITVPDERITHSIPLNPEHVHAFTPNTLEGLANVVGLKNVETIDNYNGISFTMCLEKEAINAQPVL